MFCDGTLGLSFVKIMFKSIWLRGKQLFVPEDSHYIELNHTVLVLLLLYIEHVKFCHINEIFCTILYIVCEPKNYLLVYKIIKNLTPNTFYSI